MNSRFLSDLTFYSCPIPGYGKSVNRLRDLYRRVIDVPVKFQLYILKTVLMRSELTFFEWLTLYSLPSFEVR